MGMDLKSRGQQGRSFVDRAIRSAGFTTPKNSVDHSNVSELEDTQLTKKVEALFAHEPLFERLHTEPKWRKAYSATVKGAKNTTHFVAKQKLATKAVMVIALGLTSFGAYKIFGNSHHSTGSIVKVAGVTDQTAPTPTEKPSKAKPSFEVFTPNNADMVGLERKAPSGEDIYTYSDILDGVRIEVTQQQLPESFKADKDAKLASFAKDNDLINVIKVDQNKIYHGFIEKSKIGSLVFIKEDRLIFIQSSAKLTDDQWTGYYLSLK